MKDGIRAHIVGHQVALDNKGLVEAAKAEGELEPGMVSLVVPLSLVHAIADETPCVSAEVDDGEDED